MLRSESWPSWGVGLVFGTAAGFMIIGGGAPFLALSLAVLALAFVAARSLAFLSGAFLGLGGLWFGLTVRAQLACEADRTCLGSEGVGQFLALSAVVFGIGLLLSVIAWRRRAGQLRTHAGS
ncbi:MAG: hypothetical protein ABI622_02080 [Chloroflexota bacterium]